MKYNIIFLVLVSFLFSCDVNKSLEEKESPQKITPQEKIIAVSKEIKSKPTASSYSKRSNLYSELNEFSLAIDDIKSAIELDSTNGILYYQAAKLFRKNSRINASINYAIKATQFGYNDGELYLLLGENYLIFRQYQASIDNLNEAMRMDRFNEKIYFYKGMVYKESGQLDEAQSSFQTAIELTPDYAEAYNQLITLALQRENFELASTYIASGLRFKPEDAFLWYNRGVSLQEQGLFDSSIVPYLTSIRYDSSITLASFNLAYVYNSKQMYQESITRLNHVLRLKSNDVSALYLNALNYNALGDKEKALESLKKALRANPEYKEALALYEELK